jgi:Flp pilus assembly protein TadG
MEMIILAPVFLMLFLFVVFCGRLINAKGLIDGAARDGARAASIARSAAAAQVAAAEAVSDDLSGIVSHCALGGPTVTGWAPGGEVTVEVRCAVQLSDLALLGVPGTKTLTSRQTAPVDEFRSTP